ncbi:MAG: hypothetical protein M3Z33_01940 [Actinomycetota bacterium]|nr:hypothetical protein [Actinomycetota bacterium]
MHGRFNSPLRWLGALGGCLLVPLVFAVSWAWACAPPDVGIPATSPSLTLSPTSGLAGSTTTVTGKSFSSGPVEIRWESSSGPLLVSVTGPDFVTSVTVPAATSGGHHIVASSSPTLGASAFFQVTQPSSTPENHPVAPTFTPTLQQPSGSFASTPADTAGPAIAGAALTRENGTRAVSRTGVVTVFCGRFSEPGVTGACSASSTQASTSRVGKPGRASVLRLAAQRFKAQPGRPVLLRFLLTKSSLKVLRAAKKVRMHGTVEARDAGGNLTRASFGLTLKAPAARTR